MGTRFIAKFEVCMLRIFTMSNKDTTKIIIANVIIYFFILLNWLFLNALNKNSIPIAISIA